MKWKQPKPKRHQPKSGSYSQWKKEISDDCSRQCVYCAIPETSFGGFRNFHVDHFRPKSKFPKLINEIKNLYYACAICNSFKLDDWPGDVPPKLDKPAYPDPAHFDYNSMIDVDDLGMLSGRNVASRYTISRLFLNRPQLILERRAHRKREALKLSLDISDAAIASLSLLPDHIRGEAMSIVTKINKITTDLFRLVLKYQEIRPYLPEDTSR